MSQITRDVANKLVEKAKLKKDGVYSYEGILYRVQNGGMTHYAYGGQIFYCPGHFEQLVGVYDFSAEARKKLQAL